MDFLNIEDGGWLVSLSFNISETKHVIKKLTTDIIVISKVPYPSKLQAWKLNYSLRNRRFPFRAGRGEETPAQMAVKKAFLSDKTSDLIPIGQSR